MVVLISRCEKQVIAVIKVEEVVRDLDPAVPHAVFMISFESILLDHLVFPAGKHLHRIRESLSLYLDAFVDRSAEFLLTGGSSSYTSLFINCRGIMGLRPIRCATLK